MSKTALELAIEEIEQEEIKAIEPVIEEEKVEEEPIIEPVIEEKPEPEPEVKIETKIEPDHTAIARANFEAREAKRKAAELEAQLEALRNPPKEIPKAEVDWEGNTSSRVETLEQELNRLKAERATERAEKEQNQILVQAKEEFNNYEEQFKPQAPDYEEARTYLLQSIASSIKILNPNVTTPELIKGVENALLMRGSNAVNRGINPAAAIYQEASQIGYKKKAVESTPVKSNLDAVARNREKTAGMAATSSSGKSSLTMDEVANMTNAQRQKLTEADWAALKE